MRVRKPAISATRSYADGDLDSRGCSATASESVNAEHQRNATGADHRGQATSIPALDRRIVCLEFKTRLEMQNASWSCPETDIAISGHWEGFHLDPLRDFFDLSKSSRFAPPEGYGRGLHNWPQPYRLVICQQVENSNPFAWN